MKSQEAREKFNRLAGRKFKDLFSSADMKEIIMKEQHNCRATGYWKINGIEYIFLLLAHEYLFIFEKGAKNGF